MSTVTLSQPHWAITSAENPEGIASHPLTAALPAFHRSFSLFSAMPYPFQLSCNLATPPGKARRGTLAKRCGEGDSPGGAPAASTLRRPRSRASPTAVNTAAPPPSRSTGCWIGTRVPPSWVTPSIGGVQIAPRFRLLALFCEARDEARPLRVPRPGHSSGSGRAARVGSRGNDNRRRAEPDAGARPPAGD